MIGRSLHLKEEWPRLALGCAGILLLAAMALRAEGRLWLCSCGSFRAWTSDAWGPETSQRLFDPYSLTHVLHGFLFFWLLALAAPRLRSSWRFLFAVGTEALWEILENSEFVIRRYREATAALGYNGDTVVNSLGDVIACALGFLVALRLGAWRTLALFFLIELLLLVWIRDSLLLNVLMLLHPVESIKQWQAGH